MYHNTKLTSYAQQLRKNMTKEERRLWYEYLRSYPYRFRRRDAFFQDNGILVLRFSNLDVLQNLAGVCQQIDLVVKQRG